MSSNTVFVVGAGASAEANLPTGDKLKDKITDLLDFRVDKSRRLSHGDSLILEALAKYARQIEGSNADAELYYTEAKYIVDALPQAISIDNFIDQNRGNEKIVLCGKLAIVKSILDSEKESLLYVEKTGARPTINFKAIMQTWYIQFFKLLTENCEVQDLQDRFKSITLIIFNYDRCIEHFLYHDLQNYYRLSPAEAAGLVRKINIFHPYGVVGVLPWWGQYDSIGFGGEPTTDQLLELSQEIKTFVEGTNPNSSEIKEIRLRMAKADKVVFLGFAFHKLNMKLIKPAYLVNQTNPGVKVFGTTFRVSNNDRVYIRGQVNELYPSNKALELDNLSCSEFFNDNGRSLSF